MSIIKKVLIKHIKKLINDEDILVESTDCQITNMPYIIISDKSRRRLNTKIPYDIALLITTKDGLLLYSQVSSTIGLKTIDLNSEESVTFGVKILKSIIKEFRRVHVPDENGLI